MTDDEIVGYLHESDEHVLSTAEVAAALDVSRRTAHRRLSALAEEGRIERKRIGERNLVWWVQEETEVDAPATPLRRLIGSLDAEAAADARKRSQAWRDAFDDEMSPDKA